VVAPAEAGAALAANRVDFVHEDDARAVTLGLVEQVAHAASADADKHLDKLGAGDAKERHARLAADGLREQRLTGAGMADQQHALRDTRAKLDEALGVLQKLYDLAQFLFRLVRTRHVVKRHGGL